MRTPAVGRRVLSCLVVLLASTLMVGALPAEPLGRTAKRSLCGVESHQYEIFLKPGQAVEVKIVQEDLDVKVDVSAPNGTRLFRSDALCGASGNEDLVIVAETG